MWRVGYRLAVMLADLLHPERVRTGLTISDKEAALRTIASLLCAPDNAANDEDHFLTTQILEVVNAFGVPFPDQKSLLSVHKID